MGLLTGKKVSTFYKVRPTADVKGKGKGKASSDADIKGHTHEVLSLALSGDGKLLASAGKDRRLGVWDTDTEKAEWIKGLTGHLGHKDTISVCSSFLSKYTILPCPLWVTWKHYLGTKITRWGSTRFVAAVTKLQDTGRLLTKHN